MLLNFDSETLESLGEAVVMLDRNGHITDFNQAAKPWLPACNKAANKIKALVSAVQRDNTRTPLVVDLFAAQEPARSAFQVRLCSDGKAGFILLFTKPGDPARGSSDVWQTNNMFQLIGDDVRHELTEIIQALASVTQTQSSAAIASVSAHATHLRSLFIAMDQLSRLAQVSSMFPGDRVPVPELLGSAIAAVQFSHCDYYQDIPQGASGAAVGVVYGSASWLVCALAALLQGLEAGAPRRSHSHLTVRQNGSFVAISARNSNGAPVRGAVPVPPAAGSDATLHLVASTQVPLARRIIELHGGMLHVSELDHENRDQTFAIETFTLQLPTGRPIDPRTTACDGCRVNQQVAAYANDLAVLIPCPPTQARVSDEERALLASVTAGYLK